MQDARGVIDLRRTLRKPGAVRVQYGGATGLPPIRHPFALAQASAHGLAIKVELPGERRNAHARLPPLMDRMPLVLSDHAFLRVRLQPGHGSAEVAQDPRVLGNFPTCHFFCPFHLSLLLSDGWGKFDYRNWGLLEYR